MQRYGHDRHAIFAKPSLKTDDRFAKHPSQNIRRRSHLLVFQQVDQIAQTTLVATVRCRFGKGRRRTAAQTAQGIAVFADKRVRREETLTANRAEAARNWTHLGEARRADRQTRHVDERLATDSAVCWKKGGEQAFGNSACPRNNRSPSGYRIGMRSPSSVPTTAEDGLPSSGGCVGGSSQTNHF